MALAAYIGQAGMDAAQYRAVAVPAWQREMLAELIRTARLVHRADTSLDQAVAKLNATGEAGPDLESSAAYCLRMVHRVDEMITLLSRRAIR